MATLKSSYDVTSIPVIASINGRAYIANDFDRVQVWDGVRSTTLDVGIAAPGVDMRGQDSASSGTITSGVHLIRYRYIDASSPGGTYRSNTSGALSFSITATSNGLLNFSIGTSTSVSIVRSTDAKVDTIQLEMTEASGSTYYVAATALNSATAVSINISDALLAQAELGGVYDTNLVLDTDYGVGHEQPPLAAIVAQCKNRTFLGGTLARTRTSVSLTLSSTSVTGANFSSLWSGRMLRVTGDSLAYPIASSTSTTITLTKNYAGSTTSTATVTIYSKTPNRIYWSAAANGAQLPESWKVTQMARDCLSGTGDAIQGMIDWQGDLLIAGRYSMERLVFVDDPATGELVTVPGKFGVWNQRCFIVVDSRLFGWGANGLWEMRAGSAEWISRAVDTTIAESDGGYMDIAQAAKFHGVYDPVQKTIRWFFVRTGETVAREAICLDLVSNRWSRAQWRQGIDSSTTVVDSSGNYRAVLSDSTNGRTYTHTGATDGVPSSSTGDYTVGNSSTTTVINVTDSLPTSGDGLTDLIAYFPVSGEERVISSNTSSALTLSSAIASAPAAGVKVYVGAIPFSLETEWFDADRPDAKKRAHLYLRFVPTTGGLIRVRIYQDFSASPATWTLVDNTIPPRGVVAWANGQTYVDVSMSTSDTVGFVSIPMFMDFNRYLKASVHVLSPAGTLRLLDVTFDPERGDVKRVTNE